MARMRIGKMTMILFALAVAVGVQVSAGAQTSADLRRTTAPQNAMWLDSMYPEKPNPNFGGMFMCHTSEGMPLMVRGGLYKHGLFSRGGAGVAAIDLKGAALKFVSMAGVDDSRVGRGSVVFQVWVDGKKTFETKPIKGGEKPEMISVDLKGAKQLVLFVDAKSPNADDDYAVWGGAMIVLDPLAAAVPVALGAVEEPPLPIAHTNPDEYGIHGPRVYGSTPGKPFLFLIPATGVGPLTYAAKNLPDGLKLDPATGVISGSLKKDGETVVELSVKGPKGSASRKLKIVGGKDAIGLTPQLGWNSWNVWGLSVDADKTKAAARSMIESGLAAHGFSYVNIDDGWEAPERAADGEIVTNKKFPDMKEVADYVHSLGLKIGIYSSPGPRTCGGYLGSYQHEVQDAEIYAKWGIDYLKYDWCSYSTIAKNSSLEELKKPYFVMRDALRNTSRDIFYSLCQYGMGEVWKWGAEVGGNSWRTTGDINDSWGSLDGIGFSQNGHEVYAGPGHWNDPDMLVVGKVGWGPTLHPTRLTKNEQILHITLWALVSSPMLIGCDMTQLDEFTLDLLTNDDVLGVHQDPLGKPAGRKAREGMFEVWARPLADGTIAVGLFNRFVSGAEITVNWADLGISGSQPVRDLWQKKDIGTFDGSFKAYVPAHGAVMVKIGKPKPE